MRFCNLRTGSAKILFDKKEKAVLFNYLRSGSATKNY